MVNKIVIVGFNHHNTLGIIRALGEAGYKDDLYLILHAPVNDFVSTSKYIRKDHFKRILNSDDVLESLFSLELDKRFKHIIISGSDRMTFILDQHYDELKERFYLPNAKKTQGEIGRLMDKEVQADIAINSGLNIPASLTVEKKYVMDVVWEKYPCIIKPIESVLGAKSDIAICKDREELIRSIGISSCDKFQIQEYINKKFEFQLIGVANNGIGYIPGYTTLIRQPMNTNTGYLKYQSISSLNADFTSINSFLKEIGYSGLFSMEFLRDADGKDYFMEINMRNDGNAYVVKTYGVNLPEMWVNFCLGRQVVLSTNIFKPVYFMPGFTDARNMFEVGIIKWWYQWFSAESKAVYNRHDIMPFILSLKYRFISLFKCFVLHK